MRNNLKKYMLYGMSAILVAFALLFAAPFFISNSYFFNRLEAEIFALTGEKLLLKGEKKIRFTPFPVLEAQDVQLGEGVKAKFLRLDLGGSWVLREALTSAHLTLVEGEAKHISRNQNWLRRLETLAKADSSPLFGTLRLKDFHFNFEGEDKTRLLNATLTWPDMKSPLRLEGQLEKTTHFSFFIASPKLVLSHATSVLKAEITTPNGKIQVIGDLGREHLKGQMSFEGKRLQAKANLNAQKGMIALEALYFSFQDQKGEGALTLELSEQKRMLSGTLSSEKWLLNAAQNANPPQRNENIISFPSSDQLNLDIRFSVDELVLPSAKLFNIGASLQGKLDNATLNLLRATYLNGTITGKAQLKPRAFAFEGAANGLDMSQLHLPFKMTGLADATVNFTSPSFDWLEAQGKMTLHSSKLGLTGFNLDEMLSNYAIRPLARGGFMRSLGKTQFSLVETETQFNKGQIKINRLRLETDKITLKTEGLISMPSKRLDLNSQAALKSDAQFVIPLRVEGTLDAPSLRFDPQSLISRSKAAEPLLEAARDNEAIRRVLEAIGRQVPELAPLEK